ncbi:MAG: putative dsRNA-binding protein [Trueperaceae bacterium]
MAHPKGLLIEKAQKLGLARPEFDTAKTGPEHEPVFITDVVVDGAVIGTGQGRSKRESEKSAAAEALAELSARETGNGAGKPARQQRSAGKRAAPSGAAAQKPPSAQARAADSVAEADDEDDDDTFTGPWPMFDDLLASVVDVAERRVSADLRGDAALTAIRDFSLSLYKELLADLGELVDEDDEDEEDDD